MEDADITKYELEVLSEYDLEELIPAAISGNEIAKTRVVFCLWFTGLLDKISKRTATQFKKYKIDPAELRDLTLDTVIEKITSIENKNLRSWQVCLAGWCKIVCVHHALNIVRRLRKFEPPPPADDNEDKAKEIPSAEGVLVTERLAELGEFCHLVHEVIMSFPPEDVMIMYMWGEGLKLRVISKVTGIPTSTVGKHQKKVQKAIVNSIVKTQHDGENISVEELLESESELIEGFQDLVLKSLENVSFRMGEVRVIEFVKN
jgi:DNA-directed RNA polymerase specialized sigma24 family protein